MTCNELEQKYGVPKVLIRNIIKFLGIPMFVGRGGNDFTESDLRLLDEVLEYLTSRVKLEGGNKRTEKPKLEIDSIGGIEGKVIKKTKDTQVIEKQTIPYPYEEDVAMIYPEEDETDFDDIEYEDDSDLEEEEIENEIEDDDEDFSEDELDEEEDE